MIVDSSAVLAVLYREPDAARCEAAIAATTGCWMTVANVLETSIVLEARGGTAAGHELDTFLKDAAIEPTPVSVDTWRLPGAPGGVSARTIIRRR